MSRNLHQDILMSIKPIDTDAICTLVLCKQGMPWTKFFQYLKFLASLKDHDRKLIVDKLGWPQSGAHLFFVERKCD